MLSAPELTTIMWKRVNASALKTSINGGIYKNWRPVDSAKEDFVINTVVLTGTQSLIQDGVVNLNLYIPSILTEYGKMPNDARFELIGKAVVGSFSEGYFNRYIFWIENQVQIKEQDKEEWYLNTRIRFKYHNTIT